MDNLYHFSHISAYYSHNKTLAYAYNRIELGDAYDRYAMIYFRLSWKVDV
jgi:hypothetical protein